MQRLKNQLDQAQDLYDKNRSLSYKFLDYYSKKAKLVDESLSARLLDICDRIKNEMFMWSGPKQLLQQVQSNYNLQDANEDQISILVKNNEKMIYGLNLYNQSYSKELELKQEEK